MLSLKFLLMLTTLSLSPRSSLASSKAWEYAKDYLVSQNIVSQRNGKISREAYAVVDNFLEEMGAHVKWLPIKGQVRGQAMKAQAQALPGHKHVGPKAGDKDWERIVANWACNVSMKGTVKATLSAIPCRRGVRRQLLADFGDYAVIRAYSAASGSVVKSQVIDFTNQDLDWVSGSIIWTSAQAQPSFQFEYRPIPDGTSWTYPISSKKSTQAGESPAVTIALFSDWATGGAQAIALMDAAIKKLSPDHVSHLGDIYYYGTKAETEKSVYKPLKAALPAKTPFWNIPGNHDYYAGGQPFYDTVDAMRREGMTQQEGSYFSLDAPGWRLIHLDTGYNSRHMTDVSNSNNNATYLPDEQLQWTLEMVKEAKAQGKRIAMFSHHQLFSMRESCAQMDDNKPSAVNYKLYQQLLPILSDIAIWFWGHEHSIQAYEPYIGLEKGRLIGASAIPVFVSKKVNEPNPDLVLPPNTTSLPKSLPGSIQSSTASFSLSGFSGFLKRSFVMLSFTSTNLTADYYEADFDCWSISNVFNKKRGTCEYSEPQKVWSETL